MRTILTFVVTIVGFSPFASPHMAGEMTPEQRMQMAEMHTKAAACLNSNKSLQECRDEMKKNFPQMGMGHGDHWGCPMMGNVDQPETKAKTKATK